MKKTGLKRIVLLDAHAIIHRAYHALPDFSSTTGEPTGALYGLSTMLFKIIDEWQPDYIIACFDLPHPTHRHEVYEAYKGTRAKTDDALKVQLARARDVVSAFGIPIYDAPGFEADDILGTIVHLLRDESYDIVIASGDMDTLQLVHNDTVRVFTLKKGITDTVVYNEDAVVKRYGFPPMYVPDFKGLKGDPSDNIPGVPGVGETTAQKLIALYGSLDALFETLEKEGADTVHKKTGVQKRFIDLIREHKDEAYFSKMLATIRIDAPISFALPTHTWREGVNGALLETLFSQLEFRSLTARARTILGGGTLVSGVSDAEATPLDEALVQDTLLMLWLVHSDYTNPTLEDVYTYTKTRTVPEAHEVLKKRLEKENLSFVYETIEKPLVPVLLRMHERGIALDVAYLKTLSDEYHKELKNIESRIYKHAGMSFNINSPKQLGDILFDTLGISVKGVRTKKTATGQRSTKESELQKLTGAHPIIADILVYREHAKLLSTYIDALPQLVATDGRVHTRFVQTGSTTGRLASVDPNMQNIPIRSESGARIRSAFVAQKGFSLVSLDYSQIELRLAAIISGEQKLIQAFTHGEDIHASVASAVFSVPLDAVTKEMRRRAKIINFGMLYGMGVQALKVALGEETTMAEAREFYEHYFLTYTMLAQWLDATKALAHREGSVQTLFGRKRVVGGITSHLPFVRAQAERMAINAPVQGTAADLIKRAMITIDTHLRAEGLEDSVRMLLQVHDELVFEIKDAEVTRLVPVLVSHMENALAGVEAYGVPIVVDGKIGKNWGAMTSLV